MLAVRNMVVSLDISTPIVFSLSTVHRIDKLAAHTARQPSPLLLHIHAASLVRVIAASDVCLK
ncbi:hypothetical protein Hypma_008363 [Hypsizygus marmoreus]|uniref:Uncharacterized protein n=1 Tax=Hypsizygus marmoreus TaxID=39966 RepID=A0A369JXD7_HYPMA|nr:hypothetical protein Hypma_008363 [Hypsizygus marmoreus]